MRPSSTPNSPSFANASCADNTMGDDAMVAKKPCDRHLQTTRTYAMISSSFPSSRTSTTFSTTTTPRKTTSAVVVVVVVVVSRSSLEGSYLTRSSHSSRSTCWRLNFLYVCVEENARASGEKRYSKTSLSTTRKERFFRRGGLRKFEPGMTLHVREKEADVHRKNSSFLFLSLFLVQISLL